MKKHFVSQEYSLIETLTGGFQNFHPVFKGIGDDTAVLKNGDRAFDLLTTDTLVENDHFSLQWSSPEQIGKKVMEVNVSDIAAMGGLPKYLLIALVITAKTPESWIKNVFNGIRESCEKYGITLLGGDTTHGEIHMISATLTGSCERDRLSLRSDAKPKDLVCVTGQVGGSAAGYLALKKGVPLTPYVQKRHLEPVARLEASQEISKHAHAMIDVSDGVGSEVRHICRESRFGAVIFENKLPVHQEVFDMEKKMGIHKYYCALSGGEDFELLFTVAPDNLPKLKRVFSDFSIIGEMKGNPRELVLVSESGEEKEIPGGYDHLSGEY